jgi:phosphatidylglycerophosphate synthase
MRLNDITWANRISLIRIGLAVVFISCFRSVPGSLLTASVLAAIAAQLTDHLDGYIARKYPSSGVVGWVFDSVSDRAFYIAALLAFERELFLSEIIVWGFVLREIALYAIRVVVGDFETILHGFRKLTLVHAFLVRIGIAAGCLIPYSFVPPEIRAVLLNVLPLIFFFVTVFGFINLYLLLRKLS